MARPRAQALGRRTGVTVPASQEGERLEDLLDTAASPKTEKENSTNESNDHDDKKKKQMKKKDVRFSLGGTKESSSSSSSFVPSESVAHLRRKVSGRGSLSPSEISRVSTAPPSANREDVEVARLAVEQQQEEEIADTQESVPESPMMHQADDDDDDDDAGVMDDDDDDDLIPPPPPDDEDEEILDNDEVPTQMNHSPDDFPTQMDDDGDNDDDDDNDGPGFQMTNDPKTPASATSVGNTSVEKTPSATKKVTKKSKKKKKKTTKTKRPAPDSDSEPETIKPSAKKKQRKKKSKYRPTPFSPKGIEDGPITYKAVPVTDSKEDDEDAQGLRRSKRTRIKPLEWWKGEHAEYGPNDFDDDMCEAGLEAMSTVKCYRLAEPTPYKPRKPRVMPAKSTNHSQTASEATGNKKKEAMEPSTAKPFDSSKLRKKYHYIDGDMAWAWDDTSERADDMVLVARKDELQSRALPMARRKKHESKKTGYASQSFNVNSLNEYYPGYIMGNLTLPPTAIKDAESVGNSAQTFTVVHAQEHALEIAYGYPDEDNENAGALVDDTAQRFLLKSGDMFRIPPGNCYRIENHSTTHEALLTWTIIRANTFVGQE